VGPVGQICSPLVARLLFNPHWLYASCGRTISRLASRAHRLVRRKLEVSKSPKAGGDDRQRDAGRDEGPSPPKQPNARNSRHSIQHVTRQTNHSPAPEVPSLARPQGRNRAGADDQIADPHGTREQEHRARRFFAGRSLQERSWRGTQGHTDHDAEPPDRAHHPRRHPVIVLSEQPATRHALTGSSRVPRWSGCSLGWHIVPLHLQLQLDSAAHLTSEPSATFPRDVERDRTLPRRHHQPEHMRLAEELSRAIRRVRRPRCSDRRRTRACGRGRPLAGCEARRPRSRVSQPRRQGSEPESTHG